MREHTILLQLPTNADEPQIHRFSAGDVRAWLKEPAKYQSTNSVRIVGGGQS